MPEKYVFITFGIRIVTNILKKYLEKVILRVISWVLILKNFKFAYMNNFLENVKNGFELILWLKKGGGLICKGVLYAGFYGSADLKNSFQARVLRIKNLKYSNQNWSTGYFPIHNKQK